MIIAIPVVENKGKDSRISEHFGHAPFFAFVEIENGSVKEILVERNPYEEHEPGAIPEYISSKKVSVLIVRGIGARAVEFLKRFEINVIRGASGTVEEVINSYLKGILKDTDYRVKEKFHSH
ncbi:NifB/NifX family molybdenum-iron cluster-binding protein [Thermosipho ferrireducens]|uniref:NifB/NifX family molybdenum-iron cluster-binding protein n=1 Tax=Thermosipho ferrireducens TaxID=2571116 RepID=A0ABX7S781_9BACT|nr:NifB/NifX family molybdenum-iron cluster-binding protein [Thermosipho ferrireducens]QTA38457.1 NifB/NifX family molybdenum-iron cluster-binding protein [Thermosipho ferrireducens]